MFYTNTHSEVIVATNTLSQTLTQYGESQRDAEVLNCHFAIYRECLRSSAVIDEIAKAIQEFSRTLNQSFYEDGNGVGIQILTDFGMFRLTVSIQ